MLVNVTLYKKEPALVRCLNKGERKGIPPVFINCLEDTLRFHRLGPCVFEIDTFGMPCCLKFYQWLTLRIHPCWYLWRIFRSYLAILVCK